MERYSVPSPMLVGVGAIERLAKAAVECGITRPLLLTDRGLRSSTVYTRAVDGLKSRRVEFSEDRQVFDAVSSNPREEDVLAARVRFEECEADGIIALGGGSVIDAAKGLRLMAHHDGTIVDYDLLQGGMGKIVKELPPLIAIPTTAGTGSEVSRGALIITRRGDVLRKTVVASPRLVPSLALLDPELTVGLPAMLTAGTGMDALSHGIEEHVSPRFHPVVETLALSAASKVGTFLRRAFNDPDDLDARAEMMLAAMMAGIGFEKGLGVVHSFSHAIGALHDLHHGILNAVLMPFAVEFNRDHCDEQTWRKLGGALGLPVRGGAESVDAIVDWLRQLCADLSIPARLRDLKDLAPDRDEILARALDDHCHRTNPRPCGHDDMLEFWERAW